jgi:integrase
MPRRRLPPRLYHDQTRGDWVIRDGAAFVRTGVAYGESAAAERALADYIADKYKPAPSPVPSMADVLLAYRRDKVPSMKSRAAIYNVRNLAEWWGDKTLADVTAANCRAFTATRTQAAARADLDKLAAAINHWHAEYGPLQVVPKVWKPPKPAPRERWLTRSEAAKFLWQCRRTEHLKRFVLIGLYTGSRAGVLRELQWSWIDLERRTMRRRAPGVAEERIKRTPPIRIPRKLVHFLRRWKRADGGRTKHVVHYNGGAIKFGLFRAWDNARERADLPWLHPHILRHTRATWGMQKGADPFQLAGFLGMSLRVLTETYGHHYPDFQKTVADL